MKYIPPKKKKTTSSVKFGGSIDVYCSECKDNHTIPYVPGRYRLCDASFWKGEGYFVAIVTPDGEVNVKHSRDIY